MRPKDLGVFALFGGYALTNQSPTATQNIQPPASLRPNVALGSAAAAWRAKQLPAEAQMNWQETQAIIAPTPHSEWEMGPTGDYIEDFIDPDSLGFAPPLSTQEVVLNLKTYTGSWPSLDLDETDLELFDL